MAFASASAGIVAGGIGGFVRIIVWVVFGTIGFGFNTGSTASISIASITSGHGIPVSPPLAPDTAFPAFGVRNATSSFVLDSEGDNLSETPL